MDQMDVLFGFVRPGTDYAAKVMDDAEEEPKETNTQVEMV